MIYTMKNLEKLFAENRNLTNKEKVSVIYDLCYFYQHIDTHPSYYDKAKTYATTIFSTQDLKEIEKLFVYWCEPYYSFAERARLRTQGKKCLENIGIYYKGAEWDL